MINIQVALSQDIKAGIEAAAAAGVLPKLESLPEVVVTHTDKPEERGDYASPVALNLTKTMGIPPLDIVAKIVEHMPKKEYIGKIEAAAPGFLNIRLNAGWLTARLDDVVEFNLCDEGLLGQGQLVNLEFISANPTGPLTLGNARTAFSVDTLANVLTCAGYNVTREYYINDAGAQIKKLGESVLRRLLQAQGQEVDFPEELYQGEYIKELGKIVSERWQENEGKAFEVADLQNEQVVGLISRAATELMLADIKRTIAEDLQIKFTTWTSEQHLRESGKVEAVLQKLREKKEAYVKDGVEYLQTTKYGDSQDRVLVKSNGEYAYILPDIAYHQDKYDRQFDHIFTYIGADHQGHVPKLYAAMQALGNDTKKLHVIAAQWMRFVRGGEAVSFSKREGTVYTPAELIAEVGYDAMRYFMVQHALTTHMDFDLDLAKERSERNPVYYVQYAYVRLQSIIRRAKEAGLIDQAGENIELTSHALLTHVPELQLMREMYRLPEVIAYICHSFEPQALTTYAYSLAVAIHSFYKNVPVLAAADQQLIASRLQLVLAARKVLGQTLDLLGISKPDVM